MNQPNPVIHRTSAVLARPLPGPQSVTASFGVWDPQQVGSSPTAAAGAGTTRSHRSGRRPGGVAGTGLSRPGAVETAG